VGQSFPGAAGQETKKPLLDGDSVSVWDDKNIFNATELYV
jgi:hypothetical protein